MSLLRGAIWGAAVGFAAGLLFDIANLGRLGETSLLLTVAGYWIGRYGETTGRDRTHAPLLSVAVVTILYSVGALALHVVLGDPVDAGNVLVRALIPECAAQPDPGVPRLRARAARARPPRVVGAGGAAPWLTGGNGRFLPPDPRVVEPYRLTPKLALRLAILGAVALGIFAVLFLRLWALQVLSGEQYLRAAQNNRLRTVRVDAPRGVIRDRNGNILVGNIEGTAVELWPADLPKKGRYQMLKRLGKVVDVPAIRMAREIDQRRHDPLTPVVVKENIDRAELFYLSERSREFPGMELVKSHMRDYPYGTLAAHVLGHVGEVTEEQLTSRAYAELVRRRQGRPGGCRGRVRPLPARHGRAPAPARRLVGPASQRLHAVEDADAREQRHS